MAHIERRIQEYRSLCMLLIAVAVLSAGVITSCGGGGGGGGGSDGELCDQCGDDPDGPCLDSITIEPVIPDDPSDRIPQCTHPVDTTTGTCTVELACRRKLDSGQRRCYPLLPGERPLIIADSQFRCDGSRPGGTPGPAPSVTPTSSTAPTASVAQRCGNGIREGTEDCDPPDFDGNGTCESQSCGTGNLGCTTTCELELRNCSEFLTCR